MGYFEDLKMSLKDKWLDYYEANATWIKHLMENRSTWYTSVDDDTDDNSIRPNSHFILGVVTALDPELQQMIIPCSQLNSNADQLIKAFGLDFDPEKELKKRSEERAKSPIENDGLDEIRRKIQQGEM